MKCQISSFFLCCVKSTESMHAGTLFATDSLPLRSDSGAYMDAITSSVLRSDREVFGIGLSGFTVCCRMNICNTVITFAHATQLARVVNNPTKLNFMKRCSELGKDIQPGRVCVS